MTILDKCFNYNKLLIIKKLKQIMKKLILLIATLSLSAIFTNCQKKCLTPEIPTTVSTERISPKDSDNKVKRIILKPDTINKKP